MEISMCSLHSVPVRKGKKRAEGEAGLQMATTIASADRVGARGPGLVLLLWSVTRWGSDYG